MPLSSIAQHGRLVLADGTVVVEINVTVPVAEEHHHEAQGELVLTRSGDLAVLGELTEALHLCTTRPPNDRVPFHLVADRSTQRPDPFAEALAESLGYDHRRELLQMRRPLPVEVDHPDRSRAPAISVRPVHVDVELDPGAGNDEPTGAGDVGAWLRVNNRAFASHPDQGQETVGSLRRRLAADGDDPSGFLVLADDRRPGELAGFCWTKIHAATEDDPQLGEIYVIGVDPSRHGEGLGTSLVLAGLDHLAAVGITTGMLYVEADNEPARRLYDRLGFTVHLRRCVYTAGSP